MVDGEIIPFEPRLALASLSGSSDGNWARAVESHIGAAVLGGISLDGPSRAATRRLLDRDRWEFLPPDPIAFVDEQLHELSGTSITPGINVRSVSTDPIRRIATVCLGHGAIVEINAHCRQEEMCAVGCGEALLGDTDRLRRQVEAAVDTGATVSVKVRAEVEGVDLVETARLIEEVGANVIHIDAMDSKWVVGEVARTTDLFVIANNGVRNEESVREYLDYGADAVSVGRASDDPRVLTRVRHAVDEVAGRGVRV